MKSQEKGEEKEMPKYSGGMGIIYVEINTIDNVPSLLNTLINSCVPCTQALISSQFCMAELLSPSSF